jgi:glucosamine-phosphate N-acetyltransferase
MELLSQLTVVGNVTQEDFEKRYDEMFPDKADTYRIIVIYDKQKDKVIGSTCIFLERKFIRQTGIVSYTI